MGESKVTRRFLQANYYAEPGRNDSLDVLRNLILLALRLGGKIDLPAIEWRLWRSLRENDANSWLVTEEYQNATHWGEAEDFGVDDPELRAALQDADDQGFSPHDIHLLMEANRLGEEKHSERLQIATFPKGMPSGIIDEWLNARCDHIAKASGVPPLARVFQTRVSGTRFGQTQIWLTYGNGIEDNLTDNCQAPRCEYFSRGF
ncbi:hypothetical protein PUV54_09230 [Hyphococcus flavus]|uniref:Uncharacterized protein n=1 Tax=Hyphococcus flavus TaxID=1866326 RepID=A0AAE9ZBH6_9PROT|nr:hypothetical protein [Hyphococcus flavus]WDI30140.1 hypothetical protein PUV54_09230 [Hyphococcus flavus]